MNIRIKKSWNLKLPNLISMLLMKKMPEKIKFIKSKSQGLNIAELNYIETLLLTRKKK
ncbi:MAG: hypothetical protein HC906_04120 [Bacteroidales bacterium]|nr:hypothetical protein [Bacteroidales bacterium]